MVKVKELERLLKFILQHGFEHHVAISYSQVGDILEEALGKYLGWKIYHHL